MTFTCLVTGATSAQEKKNVLFIITDDLNCYLGVYGHPLAQTPNIDKLDAEGLLFQNAHCNYPGQKSRGKETNAFVEMIDFFPTLCELAGLSYPDYVSGKSMVPVLQKPNKKFRSEALTQTVSNGYSIITKRYRYNIWGEGGPGMRELYDKQTDTEEMNNLAEDNKYSCFDGFMVTNQPPVPPSVKETG